MNKIYLLLFIVAALLGSSAETGLLSYTICQTGCNTLAATCYAAGGITFGTVTTGAGVSSVAWVHMLPQAAFLFLKIGWLIQFATPIPTNNVSHFLSKETIKYTLPHHLSFFFINRFVVLLYICNSKYKFNITYSFFFINLTIIY